MKLKEYDKLMIQLEENECLLADGFERALVGITQGSNPVAVYDINKMVGVLVEDEDMTPEDAMEHLDFNVIGAYVGEKTPMYIDLDFQRACAFSTEP
tara:strand:+ start:5771 stop:6061 length:291 start_codon:yes stop_codon:yes gene_type:complete